jgi:hypothetical protein
MVEGADAMTEDERRAHSLRRIAEEEESARAERRSVVLIALTCVLWAAIGLFFVMWSAHTTSLEHGQVALGLGVLIGNGGIVATLIYAWYRHAR